MKKMSVKNHMTLAVLAELLPPFARSAERQSARVSKIANDRLTRSGTGCFITVPIRQQ